MRTTEQTPELEVILQGWLLQALAGDRESYRKFLERISGMIQAYLHRKAGLSNLAPQKTEELVQDVLLAIHEKKHLYQRDLPLLPWIYSIARYRLIDSIRADSRSLERLAWEEEALQAATPSTADSSVERSDLSALLAALSEKQRRVLTLAKLEEMPLNEVARRLDMSLSAVKVTVHRAMQALRKRQEQAEDV